MNTIELLDSLTEHNQEQLPQDLIDIREEPVSEEVAIDLDLKFSLNDQTFYQLPNKHPFKVEDHQFDSAIQVFDEEFQPLLRGVKEYINKKVQLWDVEENQDFIFKLPPTGFVAQNKIVNFKTQLFNDEINEVRPLSNEQVDQIYQTGTFNIKSRRFPIPYVWRLSTWLIKGRQNINDSIRDDLATSIRQLFRIKNRLYSQRGNRCPPPDLVHGFYNIILFIPRLLGWLVGFRFRYSGPSQIQIFYKIEKDRQYRLNDLQMRALIKVFSHFSILNSSDVQQVEEKNQRQQVFENVIKEFQEQILPKIVRSVENAYLIQQETKDSLFMLDMEEEKEMKDELMKESNILEEYDIRIDFEDSLEYSTYMATNTIFTAHLKGQPNLPETLTDQFLELVEWEQQLKYEQTQLRIKVQNETLKFEEQISQDYPILSRIKQFRRTKIEEATINIYETQIQFFYTNILDYLKDHPLLSQMFLDYISHEKNFKQLYNEKLKISKKKNRKPAETFTCTRQLFPPFEVRQVTYDKQIQYVMIRQQTYSITTLQWFWKIQLGFLRWYVWSFNSTFWLFINALVGKFSLKALFWWVPYQLDVNVNSQTGEVYSTGPLMQPVYCMFTKVLEGMRTSRSDFEDSPDTGVFGKTCARICNLIEVYLFRLLIGIVWVLILYPIIIVLNVTLSLVLGLTSWLWMPIFLILKLIFELFIYDFDDIDSRKAEESDLLTQPICLMLWELIRLTCFGFGQVVLALLAILFHLFAFLFMIVFGILRYVLRSCYDWIIIKFVWCLGRVPATENNIAWKISGPGISRQFFYSISPEDLFILIYAQLEIIILKEYRQRVVKLVEVPIKEGTELVDKIFGLYGAQRIISDDSVRKLLNGLDKQISQRKSIMVKGPQSQIRFTDAELKTLLGSTKFFIKQQIMLKDMQGYIWSWLDIRKGDYNQLTKKIWRMAIPEGNVLEPLESLDLRIMIPSDSSINKIRQALKGLASLRPQEFEYKQDINSEKQITKTWQNPQNILSLVVQTQETSNKWTSHDNPLLSVFLNYQIREKKQFKKQSKQI